MLCLPTKNNKNLFIVLLTNGRSAPVIGLSTFVPIFVSAVVPNGMLHPGSLELYGFLLPNGFTHQLSENISNVYTAQMVLTIPQILTVVGGQLKCGLLLKKKVNYI